MNMSCEIDETGGPVNTKNDPWSRVTQPESDLVRCSRALLPPRRGDGEVAVSGEC